MSRQMPTTEEDWFLAGLILGWESPMCTAEAPAPLADNYLTAYFRGVQLGGEARVATLDEAESGIEPPTGPTIGPIPGGSVPLDEHLREQRETLEGLFHEHMPHVELPEYEAWYPPFDFLPRTPGAR